MLITICFSQGNVPIDILLGDVYNIIMAMRNLRVEYDFFFFFIRNPILF